MEFHRGQLEALNDLVNALRISKGTLVTLASIETIDKFEEQVLKAPTWKSLIGKIEFGMLAWRTIYRVAKSIPEAYEGMLSDFNSGSVRDELIGALREQFESLPGEYDIFIPMGAVQELHCGEITITESVAIADTLHNDDLRDLISHGVETNALYRALAGWPQLPKSIDSIRYLRISGSGYGDDSPQSPVVRHAWSIAKQLVFVGMASGALIPNASEFLFSSGISPINNIPTLVVSRSSSGEVFRTSPGFELGQLLHTIKFKNFRFYDLATGATLLSSEERDATTGDEIRQAVNRSMATAATFLKIESPDAAPIRAAMEWFVDADASQNETVAFLQRCIGLEALLGSSESKRDVTERLADRYSYIVANTASSRDIHRAKFIAMYKHRSEIVHGRSTKLSDEHRRASWEAREMLLQAAWREMHNVLKETRT
ncbi:MULTISPECIES: HEPN domain-containing protein [Paraburkholderia]|uniref:HEPN domain-containing protein n=1 Tax=Paraburkholderia TaxID=1822464 RepID=UPI00225A3A7F|nr:MULTISPECIES: HEPN domain-containing protein [Paraburkholderia]MCX4157018.1 HEPN domain-containing protein [Paraburkholderia aspalathi]MDN7166422.1 HEPN domain-containing protein [Paraburkholderia sp. SECH2]MDQ6394908.1 HEPN domain-containing protein [Paraburkholderia aspalathi]